MSNFYESEWKYGNIDYDWVEIDDLFWKYHVYRLCDTKLENLIKYNPNKAYEICKKYSFIFSKLKDNYNYESYFGFGSFYEDIIIL